MEEILKGTTESGFEYKIPKKRLRNYYLLKSVAKVEKQDFERKSCSVFKTFRG